MIFCRRLVAWVLLLGGARLLAVEPVDIAEGIFYFRGTTAITDVAPANAVVDLRFVPPPALPPPWVKTAAQPVIVLLAGEDVPAWLALLEGRSAPVLLLGPTGTGPGLDLEVSVPAEPLGQVVAAIDAGTDVVALSQPVVAKRRFDEAALVRHHNGDEDETDAAASSDDENDDVEPSAPPLRDPMLERAVQVIQGLRALGRG